MLRVLWRSKNDRGPMSASGPKRTFKPIDAMSASGHKRTLRRSYREVGLPIAPEGLMVAQNSAPSWRPFHNRADAEGSGASA